eukprot:GHVU01005448.1.p1 GENE.GHVU01005448.1~~GHVU01005448.1.p1  ORF type:complete len:150 (-),score=4.71 GHVU01005448.1:457-906(-)
MAARWSFPEWCISPTLPQFCRSSHKHHARVSNYPSTRYVIRVPLSREKLDKLTPANWLKAIKKWLNTITNVIQVALNRRDDAVTRIRWALGKRYNQGSDLKGSGFDVYMRDCRGGWYSLTSPKDGDNPWLPQQDTDDLPEFIVTGSEGT